MRKILSIVLLAVILFFAASCEKDFDPKIYGVLTDVNFPVSESDFESLMMACYIPYVNTWAYSLYASSGNGHPWYIPAGGVLKMFDTPTDEVAPWVNGVWDINYRKASEADFSMCVYYSRGTMEDTRPNHYPKTREVTRYTSIIATIQDAASAAVSESRRQEILAEARMCRAVHMYNLLHVYGPVPVLVDCERVYDPQALNNAVRPALDDYCDWVYDDLVYAATYLPEVQQDRGRFTRDLARVYLMRHCLNEGYHKEGYYQKALDMYAELNTGRYQLFTKGDNPYREMFREANDWNVEIIGAISCDPSSTGNAKEGGMNPFAMLATPNNAAKKDDLGNPTPFATAGAGWGMTFNISPAFYDSFDPGDLRKESIITSYYTTGGEFWGPAEIGKKAEWDGFIPYKYPAETATAPNFGNDFPLARWADVLLMYAEAQVRKSGTAPSAEAVEAVNQVRRRAGLGNLPERSRASAEAFLDALLTERGHEFWFEGLRKIDLIRFNQYAVRVARCKKTIPTHQYMPIPNYAVDEAAELGLVLEQEFSREGWENDLLNAKK